MALPQTHTACDFLPASPHCVSLLIYITGAVIIALLPAELLPSLALLCVFEHSYRSTLHQDAIYANEILLDPLSCLCLLVFHFPLLSSGNVVVLAHMDKMMATVLNLWLNGADLFCDGHTLYVDVYVCRTCRLSHPHVPASECP